MSKIRPSTYMYSPLPSDAMESPILTVDKIRIDARDDQIWSYHLVRLR